MTQALSLILWFVTHVMWQNAPCLPGGITFVRQGQVDSFNIRNPGCDQVTGNLVVNGNITRLDSLYRIKSVDGLVTISNSTTLRNLNGLQNLQSIGLGMNLVNNRQLTTLTGLQALKNIGGELLINISDSLRDINAISQVVFSTNNRITISNCPKLAICNVSSICQFLATGGTLVAQNNATGCATRYQVIKACNPGVLCPPGDITLKSQADLQDFALNFPGCRQLSGSFSLSSIENNITSLTALPKFTSVAKSLNINSNSQLLSLSGLDSLKTIGENFYLTFNPRIKNLNGLSKLQWINESLNIYNNDSLTSLQSLGPINADSLRILYVFNCPSLTVCSHPSICAFLAKGPNSTVINNNGQGCKNYLQVNRACDPTATCPPVALNLRTQNEVNEFFSLFPNCTDFQGDVLIFEENIKNLDSLYKLRSISGSLGISNCDSLRNVKGLSGLKSVGRISGGQYFGQFTIIDNSLLTSLDGLDSLTFIAREININRNDSLKDLDGMSQVQLGTNHNAFYLYDNPVLSVCNIPSICNFLSAGGTVGAGNNATGCANLYQILKACDPGLLCPPGDIYFQSQQELEDFAQSFPNCTDIAGQLYIDSDNGSVISLAPLKRVKSVRGGLNIYITFVADLHGLDSLQTVHGGFHLVDNYRLKSLAGLSSLTNLDFIYLTNNDSLSTMAGIGPVNPDSLTYISITGNPLLSACAEPVICAHLNRGGGNLINNNAPGCNSSFQIQNVCNPGSACFPGDLTIYNQKQLDDYISNFGACTHFPGTIKLGPSDEEDPIVSLAGLNKLKSIGGHLWIEGNPRLKSLHGLDSLERMMGQLIIRHNDSLVDLSGLGALKSISDFLDIENNNLMTSLNGLSPMIDSITGLFLENNPLLAPCNSPVVCNFLSTINNLVELSGNGPGCTNLSEARASCGIVICAESGDINLTTQAAVDRFPKDYPGCSRLLNGLFISGSNITNLDSLQQIKHIGFYLIITANPSLTSITGLSNLETVGSDLDISNNPLLQSAEGLSSLKSIGGYLGIYTNYSLSSLGNIDQLDYKTITEMYIQENQKLSICNIPPVCSFINDPANVDVTFIDHNKSGCETPNQVKSACGLASCPTGNITLTTQAQVNQFRSLLLDCTILPGDLTITGSDITYLDSLSVLSGINGQLRIENTSLHSLFGLGELMAPSINHLVIKNNPSLAICDVRSVCDYISLPSKTYEISGNAPTCTSVSAVMAECGKTCFRDGLVVTTQAQVDALTNLCESIPGSVYIDGSSIVRLDSFYKIKTIGGAFTIANTSLTTLHGLESLQSIGSLFDIRNNGSLTNLDGLQNLNESGASLGATIRVLNNGQLTSINGLKRIKKAYFNLIIQQNGQLTSLSGLDSVESVTNNLIISNNASLTSTAALRSLTRINNDLRIESNSMLAEADGFESLKYIGFDMRILNNGQLNTLRAFTSLDSVRNLLRIEGNNGMDSIVGLTGLDYIGRGLRIQNNSSLKNIKSLSQLTEVVRELTINNNDALASLQGLDRLNPLLLTQLSIQNSNILNLCNVRSVCNYLAITPARTATISANLMGCNSKSEILASCTNAFPVSLVSFNAELKSKSALLKWRAANSRDLEFYQPEHSADGIHYLALGIVRAKNPGYPIENYEWVHSSPLAGLNFYRLKLVGNNGDISYSDVVKVRLFETLSIFPNPTQNKVYVTGWLESTASVTVKDMMGRTLFETRVSPGDPIDLGRQPGGIYILTINTGRQESVFRVMKN